MEPQVSEVEPARNRAGTPSPDRNRFRLETPVPTGFHPADLHFHPVPPRFQP